MLFSARATCKISFGTVVRTFDGEQFCFPGACTYILVQHSDFSVIGETWRCCRRRSCLRSITIYYDGQTITLGRNGVLFINGTEETIPFFSTSVDVTTDQLGRTLVTLSNGVSVNWNGRFTAEISVPDVYEGLLEGMVHCRVTYYSIIGIGNLFRTRVFENGHS